uniref:Uncharacterized protein n=1 Tax=Romanomermis culicivorax TaxID=13658 RepID=A0A915IW52_ROMCU
MDDSNIYSQCVPSAEVEGVMSKSRAFSVDYDFNNHCYLLTSSGATSALGSLLFLLYVNDMDNLQRSPEAPAKMSPENPKIFRSFASVMGIIIIIFYQALQA